VSVFLIKDLIMEHIWP